MPRTPRRLGRDASEIPDLIRGLAAAEGEAAHAWGGALRDALVHGHSGRYFPAVEPAAPLLVELCRSDRPEVAAEDADFRIQHAIRELRAESANRGGTV
jgi:hypothetical protein